MIKNFSDDVIRPYERNLALFFDPDTGAVMEPGRQDGAPAFLFTEVTGYALLDRLLLHGLTLRQAHLDAARRACDWIVAKAIDPSGGVLTRYYFDQDERADLADKSFAGRRIYAFDTAICLRGIVALYKATRHPPYLDAAKRMGAFLVESASNAAGEVTAIYDAKSGSAVEPNAEVWSRWGGSFLSKVGEALIDLHEVTGEQAYADRARRICHAALLHQRATGAFETSRGRCELHPHCYATEGILHVGRCLGDETLIEAATRATTWALRQLDGDAIAQVIDVDSGAPLAKFRTDSLAQVLALGSDLRRIGRLDPVYEEALDKLAAKVLSMREGSQGFFDYGFYERAFNGLFKATTYSYWTQMFCMRGLESYYVSTLLERTHVAVLAGGIGSRVWPLSCETQPKHLSYSFLGDRSLLQETISRFTHGGFIRPDRVLVLCRESAMAQMAQQAGEVGVPAANMVLEPEPKGTVPATLLALAASPPGRRPADDRIIVVSMADNVIAPYSSFQDAVKAAVIAAAENDCLISVGRPLAPDAGHDDRLGHMRCGSSVSGLRVHQVEQFVEKPNAEQFDELRSRPGTLATESGAVVCRETYFRSVATEGKGNLAEHLLSKATAWAGTGQGTRVATTLLPADIKFEDFGVPGRQLQRYHAGDPRFDLGGGITCVGPKDKLQTLLCSNVLVLSDKLPIELYGLSDLVVIDADVTNTSVIMPIDDVKHLPDVFRLFQGSRGYESFITGGPSAKTAEPTAFVERCKSAIAEPSVGLVFAYNCPGRISIKRSGEGLRVTNLDLPALSSDEFKLLSARQAEDPKLVEHLLRVGSIARALLGGDFVLSSAAQEILHKLCIFHNIGGQLAPEREKREYELLEQFKAITRLDTRLLDTRLVTELMTLEGAATIGDGDALDLINHYTTSAVGFLRHNRGLDADLRDIVTMLIQVQDSPHMFAAANRSFKSVGLTRERDEIGSIFASFKAAKNFANGRWRWKRTRKLVSEQKHGFLRTDRGEIEDSPFIIAFTIDFLQQSGINPRALVSRVNDLILADNSEFSTVLGQLDGVGFVLPADRVYRYLLESRRPEAEDISGILQQILELEPGEELACQLLQVFELPLHLATIAAFCPLITQASIDATVDGVLSFYHRNWRLVSRYIQPDVLATLLRRRMPAGIGGAVGDKLIN